MIDRVKGKTAVITAAAQGIGRASAEALAAEGATVWATDINETALAALPAHPTIRTRRLDVTKPNEIESFAAEIDTVDILFNCAGVVHNGTILDCTEDEWRFALELNVTAMFRMIRALLPKMLARNSGSIINMSSVASSVMGVPNRFAYGASKAAVIGLTLSVAKDFVAKGVRCNAICPGTIATPSLEDRINAFSDPEAARKNFIARQPMGRLGTPAEIAALVVYLASEESSYTTGTVHIIDGGMSG